MPPVPSQRPSPGQVPPDLCTEAGVEGDALDALAFGDEPDAVAPAEAVLLDDEVAVPPDDAGVAFDVADAAAFDAGGGVRPRFVGRGMCRVF